MGSLAFYLPRKLSRSCLAGAERVRGHCNTPECHPTSTELSVLGDGFYRAGHRDINPPPVPATSPTPRVHGGYSRCCSCLTGCTPQSSAGMRASGSVETPTQGTPGLPPGSTTSPPAPVMPWHPKGPQGARAVSAYDEGLSVDVVQVQREHVVLAAHVHAVVVLVLQQDAVVTGVEEEVEEMCCARRLQLYRGKGEGVSTPGTPPGSPLSPSLGPAGGHPMGRGAHCLPAPWWPLPTP